MSNSKRTLSHAHILLDHCNSIGGLLKPFRLRKNVKWRASSRPTYAPLDPTLTESCLKICSKGPWVLVLHPYQAMSKFIKHLWSVPIHTHALEHPLQLNIYTPSFFCYDKHNKGENTLSALSGPVSHGN